MFTPFHPLLGGTEDFGPTSHNASPDKNLHTHSTSAAMFDELILHWRSGVTIERTNLDMQPFLFSLIVYYPLRLIAAEWVNYTAAMCFSMKQSEVSPSDISYGHLGRIAMAHDALDSWSRRVLSSKAHIDAVLWLLREQQVKGIQNDKWIALLEDFEFVRASLGEHAAQIENAASLVYSHIHLAEARRAFGEAKNISRLTILSLFFIPLSYVSTLFSMNTAFVPGGPYFWVYFTVAIPVLLCVFGLAWSRT